jgi:hypothetical protein
MTGNTTRVGSMASSHRTGGTVSGAEKRQLLAPLARAHTVDAVCRTAMALRLHAGHRAPPLHLPKGRSPTPAHAPPRSYPGLTILDLVGPLQVLTALEKFAPSYPTVLVGATRDPVPTDIGVPMVPDRTFDEVPTPVVVVVPGGAVPTIRAMNDPAIRHYVRTPPTW